MRKNTDSQSAFFNLRALTAFLLGFVGLFLALLAAGALPSRFGETDVDSKDQTGTVALTPASVAQSAAAKRIAKTHRTGGASKNTVPTRSSATKSSSGGAPAASNSMAQTQPANAGPNTVTQHNNALGQTVYSISPSNFDVSPPLKELATISLPEPVEQPLPEFPLPSWRIPRSNSPDPVVQVVPPPRDLSSPAAPAAPAATPSTGFNFEGVGGSNGYPSDSNGSVGNDQYVETVNSRYQVWSLNRTTKTATSILGPVNINTLWSGFGGPCQSQNAGDPVVLYDKIANRWLISQFTSSVSGGFYYQCVAISTTADATGTYSRYAFAVPNGNFGDYPKYGVWTDAYYVMAHNFTSSSGTPSYVGGCFGAMNRTKMLAGDSTATWQVIVDPNEGGHLPADIDGFAPPPGGAPGIFASVHTDGMYLYRMKVDFTNPANTTRTLQGIMPIASASAACGGGNCIPQPQSAFTLDSLADRLMFRLAYRNYIDHESLVVSHSVDPNVTGLVSGVRWYEFRISGQLDAVCSSYPCTYQQGTVADAANGRSRWMPSVAMDGSENILVGYSATGTVEATDAHSIRYTARTKTDPLGTMTAPEAIIFTGTRNITNDPAGLTIGRWGDYSSMSSDPADDCTFWYVNQYYALGGTSNGAWHTRIGSSGYPAPQCQPSSCTTRPTAAPIIGTASAIAPNQIQLTWSAVVPAPGSYAIERAIFAPGDLLYQPVGFVSGSATSFTDTTVQGGVTYTYRVIAATDAAGRCQALVRSGSASATATGNCSLKPAFAGLASASSNDNSTCGIALNWSPGTSSCPLSSTVTYNVYRGTVPDFVPAASNRIASCIAGNSYIDSDNVTGGNTYYYVVRAEDNSTGNGGACGGNEEFNNVHLAGTAYGSGASASLSTWTDGGGDVTGFLRLNTTDPGNTNDPTWRIVRTVDDPGANHTSGGGYAYRNAGPGPNAIYGANLCSAAETPVLTVGSTSINLTYWERHQMEKGWDGVALEYSRNGGPWTDVPAASNLPTDGCMITDITTDYAALDCTGAPPINACDYPASKAVITGPAMAGVDCTTWTTGAITDYGRRCHVLTGLTPGDTIQFRWRFTSDPGADFKGFYLDDIAITNIRLPNSCTPGLPLSFVSAASRLTHGGAGTFDINLPLAGQPGIECRGGSGNYIIALRFSNPVNGGSAAVSSGNVSNVTFSGNEMIVALSGIANQQVVTLTATNITGQNGGIVNSASVNIGFLLGDVNSSTRTDNGDAIVIRNLSGTIPTAGNTTAVRADVNLSGRVDNGDAIVVRNNSGAVLPP
jgi:hypothetical protein